MAQLNMNINSEFEEILSRYMRIRNIQTKSEALRTAVREGLASAIELSGHTHFRGWIGMGCGDDSNPNPRFSSDNELWED